MAETGEMKKTLNLTGVTVNAMALIAPGAFLWITFQVQAAQVDMAGKTTAMDMFAGLVLALILAFSPPSPIPCWRRNTPRPAPAARTTLQSRLS